MNFFSTNGRALKIVASFLFLYFFSLLFFAAPRDFPKGIIFQVERGSSLRSVSLKLKEAGVIRSRLAFEAFAMILGKEGRIIGADYYFEKKLSVYEVARRIAKGEHHMAPIVFTIPEGFNTAQIAKTFASMLPNFDEKNFLEETKNIEGRLFPDTYFLFTTATEKDVIRLMSENFNKKIKTIRLDIELSGRTEKEILIMSSIIEGEANGDIDRGLISGILWKRLGMGMRLQVDSAIETYKKIGLPKEPINNPGLKALKAAIYPEKSSYLYYLHDKKGNIHYAKTFIEHRQNVLKYLK